jgi:hypothetical protein
MFDSIVYEMNNRNLGEQITCTKCECRNKITNVNEAGICHTCEHFEEMAPRFEELENRLSELQKRNKK